MNGVLLYLKTALGLGLPSYTGEVRHHSGYFRIGTLQGWETSPDRWASLDGRSELNLVTMEVAGTADTWADQFAQTSSKNWIGFRRFTTTLGGEHCVGFTGLGNLTPDQVLIALLAVHAGRGVSLGYGARFSNFGEKARALAVFERIRKGFHWV